MAWASDYGGCFSSFYMLQWCLIIRTNYTCWELDMVAFASDLSRNYKENTGTSAEKQIWLGKSSKQPEYKTDFSAKAMESDTMEWHLQSSAIKQNSVF